MIDNFSFLNPVVPQLADLQSSNEDNTGVAPADSNGLFELFSGEKITAELLGREATLQFTSANRVDFTDDGNTVPGSYTFEKTEAGTAALELHLDNGDSYNINLKFTSATSVNVEFPFIDGLAPAPIVTDIKGDFPASDTDSAVLYLGSLSDDGSLNVEGDAMPEDLGVYGYDVGAESSDADYSPAINLSDFSEFNLDHADFMFLA